ncbi:sulfatase-like hydrolase/transferase [Alteromonas ponticola]|uniref:Sulfatase-like hydrolase/transferase n=1 Tax=Alteromonas aquimaris TaxID=2998417 RepID=A0ABT3P4B0_9ALTE|nr:sulfatase-like hydrolase/transferase [Alteromonas aquimaris]
MLWLDALLFVQYRLEVNRQTISWFFTGSKGISKGIPHLFSLGNRDPWLFVVPFLWFGLVLMQTLSPHFLSSFLSSEWHSVAGGITMFAGATVVITHQMKRYFSLKHPFFSSVSLLGKIFHCDHFEGDESILLKPEHQSLIAPESVEREPTKSFGQCKNANVILITMESLGNYLKSSTADGIKSQIAKRFGENSWTSKQHFCLCPNTTVATNQIYTGGYSNNPYNRKDSLYPGSEPLHIKHLKANGYTTLFLDSADIGLYDYHKLLTRIGFDHVWGTKDIPEQGLEADYRLWNMVDEIASKVNDSPFFLHLINDQTHMPYKVVDTKRFSRHKGSSDKATYLNAAEEVDFIFDTFLNRLADKVDLSNTILIFTGDHGESFGEYGYNFHSNSIIFPQVQVPFMLTHPALRSMDIAHSSHFDIFPTLFDLLGISFDYPCLGKSMLDESREFAYFFHSATLKGNTPANFGVLYDEGLFWVDRLFNQVRHVQGNYKSKNLVGKKRDYYCYLLQRMLKVRGLMK